MENYGQAVLVTGRRGVGKTTVCQAVAQLARRRGYRPGGVITPALYACPELVLSKACPEPRRRVEGRSRRACPEPVLSKACPEPRRRVEGQSRRAVAARCDLLIVDEIGPLELEQGKGFAPILELLPVEGPTHTLIVVRPAFVDQLLLHLRIQSLQVFNVTEENRDELPLRIVEELWGDGCLS